MLALAAVVSATGFESAAEGQVAITVDLTHVVQRTDAYSVGVDISTYGATALNSPTQAAVEQRLDARTVRIPVAVRGGVITSGAAGAGTIDVTTLVARYRSWGYHVVVVIAGRTNDVDVAPGDTTRIVSALGFDNGVQYTTSNEPGNEGRTTADVVTQARMMLAEGRKLYPDFALFGPVASRYDPTATRTFVSALGPAVAGIDYHRYAMGTTSISTAAAMALTPQLEAEVRATKSIMTAYGAPADAAVAVDETNLTWRYQDGTPGGDNRLFTSVATTWIASACGHILLGGGRCVPYAMQAGPLGMTVEAGTPNPDARPTSTTMPGYWGIGAWTGASVFPHMAGAMYATSVPAGPIETFAVSNEAGGYNLVVINTSVDTLASPVITLQGLSRGTYVVYPTDPGKPYTAPKKTSRRTFSGGSITLRMVPMSVATVVISKS